MEDRNLEMEMMETEDMGIMDHETCGEHESGIMMKVITTLIIGAGVALGGYAVRQFVKGVKSGKIGFGKRHREDEYDADVVTVVNQEDVEEK